MDVNRVVNAMTNNNRMGQSSADRGKIAFFCHNLLQIIAITATAVNQRVMQKAHRGVAPLARGVNTSTKVKDIHWMASAWRINLGKCGFPFGFWVLSYRYGYGNGYGYEARFVRRLGRS
jgi:hypothetical protein